MCYKPIIIGILIVAILVFTVIAVHKMTKDGYIASVRDEILKERADEDDGMEGKYYKHRYNVHQVRRPIQSNEDD